MVLRKLPLVLYCHKAISVKLEKKAIFHIHMCFPGIITSDLHINYISISHSLYCECTNHTVLIIFMLNWKIQIWPMEHTYTVSNLQIFHCRNTEFSRCAVSEKPLCCAANISFIETFIYSIREQYNMVERKSRQKTTLISIAFVLFKLRNMFLITIYVKGSLINISYCMRWY